MTKSLTTSCIYSWQHCQRGISPALHTKRPRLGGIRFLDYGSAVGNASSQDLHRERSGSFVTLGASHTHTQRRAGPTTNLRSARCWKGGCAIGRQREASRPFRRCPAPGAAPDPAAAEGSFEGSRSPLNGAGQGEAPPPGAPVCVAAGGAESHSVVRSLETGQSGSVAALAPSTGDPSAPQGPLASSGGGAALRPGARPAPRPASGHAPNAAPSQRPTPPPPPTCPRAPRPPPTRPAPPPGPAAEALEPPRGPARPSQRPGSPPLPPPAAMDVYPPHRLGLPRAWSAGGSGRGSPSVRYAGPRLQWAARQGIAGCWGPTTPQTPGCGRAWLPRGWFSPKRLSEERFPGTRVLCRASHNGSL